MNTNVQVAQRDEQQSPKLPVGGSIPSLRARALYDREGEPANLEAAALDALGWLEFWYFLLDKIDFGQYWDGARRGQIRGRMAQSMATLQKYLPEQAPIMHEKEQGK